MNDFQDQNGKLDVDAIIRQAQILRANYIRSLFKAAISRRPQKSDGMPGTAAVS